MEFYNSQIQMDKKVIDEIFSNFTKDTKMLVFGLGYDSKMWYEGNNKNTYFVENKQEYIDLNTNDIPLDNIIQYDYDTLVATSFNLTDNDIGKYTVNSKLLNLAPFDIIIIDGPQGYSEQMPGRLIPCYWSTLLSKKNTLIFIDDANRRLESYCINKYFSDKEKKYFIERDGCVKITY
jgi:hypothetical protein